MKLAHNISKTTSKERIAGLDTLRFFAAISVMFAHLFSPLLPGYFNQFPLLLPISEYSRYLFTGGPAVIVFFVISGFCIHFPYRNRALPTIPFLIARWLRISIPMIIAYLVAQAADLKAYNIIDGFILWSVVCELVYYSIYPLLLLLSRKAGWTRIIVGSLIISTLLLFFLGSDEYGNIHVYGFYLNWLILLPCWLLGVILAHNYGNNTERQPGKLELYLLRLTIALLASILTYLTLKTRIGYYITLIPYSFVCFFWLRVELKSFANRNPSPILEYLGKFSYSIYLFHVVGAALLNLAIMRYQIQPFRTFTTVTLVFGMCCFFYLSVEKPAHMFSRRIFTRLSKTRST